MTKGEKIAALEEAHRAVSEATDIAHAAIVRTVDAGEDVSFLVGSKQSFADTLGWISMLIRLESNKESDEESE